jgi:hypothetical protein
MTRASAEKDPESWIGSVRCGFLVGKRERHQGIRRFSWGMSRFKSSRRLLRVMHVNGGRVSPNQTETGGLE